MQVRACHPSDIEGILEYNVKTGLFQGTAEVFAVDTFEIISSGLRSAGINISVKIQPNFGVGSLDPASGRYDGCLGMVQRNQSDMILQLFEYPLATDNLTEGIIFHETMLTLTSAYEKVESTLAGQIMTSFSSFSWGIWFICSLLVLSVSLLLRLRCHVGVKQKMIEDYSLFYTLVHSLRIHHMPDKSATHRLLFISVSIFSLIVVHCFLTLIKTELVVAKDPILFNSYQDMIDRGAMPIFVRGLGHDKLFMKESAPAARRKLWRWASKSFSMADMYILPARMPFLLAAIQIAEQKAVFIIENALTRLMVATGCPLLARSPSQAAKLVSWAGSAKHVHQIIDIVPVPPREKEALVNYSRRSHREYEQLPEFLIHSSVDPSEIPFSQGLVLNPRSNPHLLHSIISVIRRAIETGLTKHTMLKSHDFNMLDGYNLLEAIAGPELPSRRRNVAECKSLNIFKTEATFHQLSLNNYSTLFLAVVLLLLMSCVLLTYEVSSRKKNKFIRKKMRRQFARPLRRRRKALPPPPPHLAHPPPRCVHRGVTIVLNRPVVISLP